MLDLDIIITSVKLTEIGYLPKKKNRRKEFKKLEKTSRYTFSEKVRDRIINGGETYFEFMAKRKN
tara:strand:- start:510 stop:704 length:195 start_codon:yes stop_codon:yes gene_type:complete